MLTKLIEKLIAGQHLTRQESDAAMSALVSSANVSQSAAFLVLLRAKGVTADELVGFVQAMSALMNRVTVPDNTDVLDIVGTGGDKTNTVNISTGASVLVASCGVKVAKHGNRAVSSQCGAADVLEALGVHINLNAQQVAYCIMTLGIGFCFAPQFHPSIEKVKNVRSQLRVATVFNILGPLLNPAQASYRMIGVYDKALMPLMADVLSALAVKRSLVFHGVGLDEISCVGPVEVIEVAGERQQSYTLSAESVGLAPCTLADLRGQDKTINASLLRAALTDQPGPIQDTLLFNAGVALKLCGQSTSIVDGIACARAAIKTGQARALLDQFAAFTQQISAQGSSR